MDIADKKRMGKQVALPIFLSRNVGFPLSKAGKPQPYISAASGREPPV